MFARVITTQAGENGFDDLIRSANRELPAARQRPGFEGYLLLTDGSTGDAMIISLWQTREDMESVARGTRDGIRDIADADLGAMRLATFEVAVQA